MSSAEPQPVISALVTDRAGAPEDGSTIVTPGAANPNLVVTVMSPLLQTLVRGLRTYIQGLVGFLLLALTARGTLESLGVVVPPGDFLAALQTAAGLALAPTVISLLQNTAELLAKFDEMFPKSRA